MKVIQDLAFGDHFIQVDDYNFSVYKTKTSKKEKQEYTSLVGHYPTLTSALTAMATDMVRHEDRDNLTSYINELNTIYNKFEKLNFKHERVTSTI